MQTLSVTSEKQIQDALLKQLAAMGYEILSHKDENFLEENWRVQTRKRFDFEIPERELDDARARMSKAGAIAHALHLRNENLRLNVANQLPIDEMYINRSDISKNTFQAIEEVTLKRALGINDDINKNRYDVVLLINGIPVVLIELKRPGVEVQNAFNQLRSYHENTLYKNEGLMGFTQLLVGSNQHLTRYMPTPNQSTSVRIDSAMRWREVDNTRVDDLSDFADALFEPTKLVHYLFSSMLIPTVTQDDSGQKKERSLFALRAYQKHAVDALVEKAKSHEGNAYVWHTTGSGKTLTSFKASQEIARLKNDKGDPLIKKVIFCVDRKDLNTQTLEEYKAFNGQSDQGESIGDIIGTSNSKRLVEKLNDEAALGNIVVTTIQKLNNALKTSQSQLKHLRDERLVFIFDECHRSQFGEAHQEIVKFFREAQMFGFTGTPIFGANAVKGHVGAIESADGVNQETLKIKKMTRDLFGDCVHKYQITDAIADGSVLPFNIDYFGRYQIRDESSKELDLEVNAIERKEIMESPERIRKIAEHIHENFDTYTQNRNFGAILCTNSIKALRLYMSAFQELNQKSENPITLATIFNYAPHEASDGEENDRNALAQYIEDYSQTYKTNHSLRSFGAYFADIQRRVKRQNVEAPYVDLLIVVDMLLTGFDAKEVNTLFVDKNLRYHGLIQAYSRTNRVLSKSSSAKKPHGNIVVYRNLREATEKALALFAGEEDSSSFYTLKLSELLKILQSHLSEVQQIAPTADDVRDIQSEENIKAFVMAMRHVKRALANAKAYPEFSWGTLSCDEQEYIHYLSHYKELARKTASDKRSVLHLVDFELEQQGESVLVNFDFLTALVEEYGDQSIEVVQGAVQKLVDQDERFHLVRDLIESFISQQSCEMSFVNYARANFDLELEDLAKRFNIPVAKLAQRLKRDIEKDTLSSAPALDGLRENVSESFLERRKRYEELELGYKTLRDRQALVLSASLNVE